MDRILIADDSPATRNLLKRALEAEGFAVVLASDGREAWEVLKTPDAPRLAILDWMMPGMSGPEICARIRAQRRGEYTYMILLTARNKREDLIEGLNAGADDYLTKPLDVQQLQARLRAARRILGLERNLIAAQQQIRKAKDDLEVIHQLAPSALFTLDCRRRVTSWNRRSEELTGLSAASVLGQDCPFHPNSCREECDFSCPATHSRIREKEISFRRPDGEERLFAMRSALMACENHQEFGAIGCFDDITELRKQEERIRHLSYHDALTGLPNRTLMEDRLSMAVAAGQRQNRKVALLFIDLDSFKNVNDTLGHFTGDTLLRLVADRLRGCLREEDSLGRQGGDEFLLILTDLEGESDAAQVARKIARTLETPFIVNGREIIVSASIGVSIFPEDGRDFETLTKHADLAMYQAKETGRNQYQFFSPEMNVRLAESLAMEMHLRGAIKSDELFLVFQPQVNLRTGEIVGAEALLRWENRELGLVPTERFIALAEERGLILEIGDWVLRKACTQARLWQDGGLRPVPISVNLSPLEFRQKNIVARIAGILTETGLDPQWLVLEITEGISMLDIEMVIESLHGLKKLGVKIAIDDFGTGHSSLSYLSRFPIDKLKVDRSFIHDLDTNADARAITNLILDLARNLKLKVVAEGVETEGQLRLLLPPQCDEMQGYYFSRPLIAEEFADLLRASDRSRRESVPHPIPCASQINDT